MQTTETGGGALAGIWRFWTTDGEERGGGGGEPFYGKAAAGREPNAAAFFTPFLHPRRSALLVLLADLGVACEDKIVIVELCQLTVETLVAVDVLGRRKDTATFRTLEAKEKV